MNPHDPRILDRRASDALDEAERQVERRSGEKWPCPSCQSPYSVVVRPTWTGAAVTRIRQCRECRTRYETSERFVRIITPRRKRTA
jgi:hypothetical protein